MSSSTTTKLAAPTKDRLSATPVALGARIPAPKPIDTKGDRRSWFAEEVYTSVAASAPVVNTKRGAVKLSAPLVCNATPVCDTGSNARMKSSAPTPETVSGTSTVSPAVSGRASSTVTVFVPPSSATSPGGAQTETHKPAGCPVTATPGAVARLEESAPIVLRASTDTS